MKAIALFLGLAAGMEGASWRADLEEAKGLREAGQSQAAERVFQKVLEEAPESGPVDLNAMGMELFYMSRYRDAESLYRLALAGWDRLGPKTASSRAITGGNLATLLRVEGRYAEAETLLLAWLKQAEAASGPEGLDTGRAANSLAALYLAWGYPAKAKPFAVRANFIFEQGLKPDAPERSDSGRILASILLEQGQYEEGKALLDGILKALPDRFAVGAYNDLAVAESGRYHFSEAEQLVLVALDRAHRALPERHPLVAVTLNNLAQVQRFQGRYLEAETNYREAIDIWETTLGPKHPDVAKGLMNLAAFYHERGREAGAEDLYLKAAGIFEAAYGKDHPLALVARNELGDVLRTEHRFSESEKLCLATLGPLEKNLGDRDPRVLRALVNYARLLQETRRVTEAAAIRSRIQGLAQGFR